MTTLTTALPRPAARRAMAVPARRAVPAAARPAGAGFRLSRRGRLVFRGLPLMLAVAVLTAVLAFLAGVLTSPAAASSDGPGAQLETVTVLPGDSLWSIAAEVAPDEDPFTTMTRIAELNSLEGRELELGETLFVPVAG